MMEDLLADIAELYAFNPVGGALHIVLDDGNTDDESIKYCLETCKEHWSVVGSHPENVEGIVDLIMSIGNQLLKLPKTERDRLYNNGWVEG
jgi:hypothetical protein